uniref:Uncharacterized protein n=1 Tax=Sphaerodactylus townsendi TaxID=933632 RepID=A0ACB8GEB1_9SAUR
MDHGTSSYTVTHSSGSLLLHLQQSGLGLEPGAASAMWLDCLEVYLPDNVPCSLAMGNSPQFYYLHLENYDVIFILKMSVLPLQKYKVSEK